MAVALLFLLPVFTIAIFAFLLLLLLELLGSALVEVEDPLAELFLFIVGGHI